MALKVEDRTKQLLAKGDKPNYSALGTEERQVKIAIYIEDTAIIRPWAGIYRPEPYNHWACCIGECLTAIGIQCLPKDTAPLDKLDAILSKDGAATLLKFVFDSYQCERARELADC
jgi:hypothetical protein